MRPPNTNCRLLGYLLPALLGLASGCTGFLDVDSEDQLSRAELFSTLRGADAAVTGLYFQLGAGYYQFRLPVYADLQGNMVPRAEEGNDPAELNGIRRGLIRLHGQDVTPLLDDTGFGALYSQAYTLLFQANDIIEALSLVADGTPEQRASLAAEAYAIRAIVHFDLVRLFAQAPGFTADARHPGIVLIDGTPQTFDLPARATVAETYALIRADLERALADLDPRFSVRSSAAPVWLTPTVVRGLLARVAAYANDWEACREWADRCLAGSERDLIPRAAYLADWRAGTLGEMLWEIDLQQLTEADLNSDLLLQTPARIIGTNNEVPYLEVSPDLLAQYAPNDLRRELLERGPGGELLSAKWPLDTNAVRNTPILRLSEVYLLRAEANAELGNLEAALADYLVIHRRAVPEEGAAEPERTAAALRAAIRAERRRELAFEGHHFYDLGRWGADLERGDDCAAFLEACTLRYPDPRFILPLPFEAVLRNPNLIQNPGYE